MAQDGASYSLKGQKVVIVGGNGGRGLGAARAAAAAGAEVLVASRRPATAPAGSDRDPFQRGVIDLTDESSIRRLFEAAGDLDHLLVTATPPAKDGPFLPQDLSAAQAIMNGKFFGSWACGPCRSIRCARGSSTATCGTSSTRRRARSCGEGARDVSGPQNRHCRGRGTRRRVPDDQPVRAGAVLEISGGETLVRLDI